MVDLALFGFESSTYRCATEGATYKYISSDSLFFIAHNTAATKERRFRSKCKSFVFIFDDTNAFSSPHPRSENSPRNHPISKLYEFDATGQLAICIAHNSVQGRIDAQESISTLARYAWRFPAQKEFQRWENQIMHVIRWLLYVLFLPLLAITQ